MTERREHCNGSEHFYILFEELLTVLWTPVILGVLQTNPVVHGGAGLEHFWWQPRQTQMFPVMKCSYCERGRIRWRGCTVYQWRRTKGQSVVISLVMSTTNAELWWVCNVNYKWGMILLLHSNLHIVQLWPHIKSSHINNTNFCYQLGRFNCYL